MCVFPQAVSDFHFLLYLSRMDMLPIKPIIGDLLQAIRRQDAAAVQLWKAHEVWSTLETLITASSSNTSGYVCMVNYAEECGCDNGVC